MARINLLPWREELRKQKQQDFFAMMGAGVFVTIVLGVVVYLAFSQLITAQNARNNYLKEEIKILDAKIEEIKALESERELLIARMKAIEALQTTRPLNVRMLDELAARNPDGVSFENMAQTGAGINIEGVAQSNARVSSLMRNLDASEWLSGPKLKVIEVREEENTRRSYYTVGISQQTSSATENAEGQQ